jgi:multiple sugar transport system permease protein
MAKKRFFTKKDLIGYLFASPWLIGFAIFNVYAIIAVIYYSFCDYSIIEPPKWIGIGNYIELFRKDELVPIVFYNTLYYTVFAVPLGMIVAFFLASLLNHEVRGISWFRAIFYVPSVVPAVASSILWLWIFRPRDGLLNILLGFLGINGPNWLASLEWSKPALIIMSTWGVGGSMLIFLAGLQDVPRQLYEAAEIDGANGWVKFWKITIPMMTPTIFFVLVTGVIGSFQVFTAAYIMTQGGPGNSTMFYVLYLFNKAFRDFRMGYASALALILFLVILIISLILLFTSEKWVYYEARR